MLMNSDLNKQIQFSISLVRTCFRLCKKTYLINFFFYAWLFFFFFYVSEERKTNDAAGVLWVMNSLLAKVTDSGWREPGEPTCRLQRGKDWQGIAISPSCCLSYVGYSDKKDMRLLLVEVLHYSFKSVPIFVFISSSCVNCLTIKPLILKHLPFPTPFTGFFLNPFSICP